MHLLPHLSRVSPRQRSAPCGETPPGHGGGVSESAVGSRDPRPGSWSLAEPKCPRAHSPPVLTPAFPPAGHQPGLLPTPQVLRNKTKNQNARETRSHQRLRNGRLHGGDSNGAAQGRSAFHLGPRRAGFSCEDRYVRGQTGTRLNLATSPAHGTDPGRLDRHRSVAKPQPLPSGAPLPLPCVDPHG